MKLPTKLFHYSAHEIKELNQDFHDKHREQLRIFTKPHGFWFSVEDFEDDENWKTWCEAEGFRLDCLKYRYVTIILPHANILHLQTEQSVIDFGIKYAGNGIEAGIDLFNMNKFPYIYWIDWSKVMLDYDGLIIAPYQGSCRLAIETTWYYGWDCASGCIWNMSCIKLDLDSIQEETPVCQEVESEKDSHKESAVR